MSIRHITDTKGNTSSRRFIAVEKPALDLDALERQIRMEKDLQNSKTRIHLCTLQELIDAARLGLGASRRQDRRRFIGNSDE